MAQIALPVPGSNTVTSGPPHRAILRLALPTVAAMLTQNVVNEIDIVFFARLPCPESSNAQTALLPSLIILWIFGGSISSISVGTQSFTGRRFAEKRFDDAGAVLANAAFFAVVAGLVSTVLGYLAMPHVLGLILKTPAARAAAESYLGYRLLGIMSMAATFAFKAFFDAIGKPSIHLISAGAMNALNIALCTIFIFGNPTLGVAKMGIAGAGLAGVLSTYVGLAIMVAYAMKPEFRSLYKPFSFAKLDRGLTWSILKLSIPSAVATVAVMTGFMLFAKIASELDVRFPSQVVSALCGAGEPINAASMTVIVGVLKLTFTACLAFGTSTATRGVQMPITRIGARAACCTRSLWETKARICGANTASSRPTRPKMARPSFTDVQPKRSALAPSCSPSDCATSVAVDVPKARHAVNVSLRTPTITVIEAALIGSAPPHIAETTCDGKRTSSSLAILAKSMKPVITATVATALGMESLRMDQVSARSSLANENGLYRLRNSAFIA